MQITTLKTGEYRNCNVYVRTFFNVFEYLFVLDGKVYTGHVVIRPKLHRLLSKTPYTDLELKTAAKMLWLMAEATIDEVLNKEAEVKPIDPE